MKKIIAERYELLELIGQGGMADVYLAQDIILNRTIAIKILRTSLAKDPIYVTRFQREASAAAALSHKNIVEIYDVGEDDDKYYIVMEYVPGTTLKELVLKRGAVHVIEAVDIMKQVISGISKAHQLGIIHRDLKPQNILVTDSGVAKIADFGIASMQSLAQVTQTDVIMGSLHYLAPELARGEKATSQSDIYALGIVFFELLRGEVPFNGESPVNIALKHVQEDLPSLLEFNPSIPQSVENIIIKATAKNLNDRYHSATEMLEDLNTCMERTNEKKLEFVHNEQTEPTIIIEPRSTFNDVNTNKVRLNEEDNKKEDPVKESGFKAFINKIKGLDIKAKIAIVVATLMILAVATFAIYANVRPDTNLMPNLEGKTEKQALKLLKDYNITIDSEVKEELSEKWGKGKIIETDPKSGTTVKEGDVVKLTISKGKYIIVKDYVGMDIEKAQEELEDLGFEVVIDYEISSKAKGVVIEQNIDEDEKIDPNDKNRTIKLTVSKGNYLVVKDYLGMDSTKAKEELEKLGFTVEIEEKSSEKAVGTVIDQSLKEGYRIDPDDKNRTMVLTVSTGISYNIRSVIGYEINSAKSLLESEAYAVVTLKALDPESLSEEEIEDIQINVVVKQSFEGTVNKKGQAVTLYYYDHKPDSSTDE